jgi:hypothetical protein
MKDSSKGLCRVCGGKKTVSRKGKQVPCPGCGGSGKGYGTK